MLKINDTQRIGNYRQPSQPSELRSSGTSGKRQKDEVRFSAEAMELLGANTRPDETDRPQRIEKLKQDVSSGTYRVDSGKLADKMIPFIYPLSGK